MQDIPAEVREVKTALRDIAAVPSAGLQWWYLTGQLWNGTACDEQTGFAGADKPPQYGVQLTWFLQPQNENFAMLAQMAESNATTKTHTHSERAELLPQNLFSGIASARTDTLDLRMMDWNLKEAASAPRTLWSTSLTSENISYDLLLQIPRQRWLHGNAGQVEKLMGQSNYYMTRPFLVAHGKRTDLSTHAQTEVCGSLWYDREVGVHAVDKVGWQWFAVRFASGDAFMIYDLRAQGEHRIAGEWWHQNHPENMQNIVVESGKPVCLASGRCYPQEFKISFGDKNRHHAIFVKSSFPEQEMAGKATEKNYWEGMASAHWDSGIRKAEDGFAYVEVVAEPKFSPPAK